MSRWTRMLNVLSGKRLNREIDEELQSHLEEAIDRGPRQIGLQREIQMVRRGGVGRKTEVSELFPLGGNSFCRDIGIERGDQDSR